MPEPELRHSDSNGPYKIFIEQSTNNAVLVRREYDNGAVVSTLVPIHTHHDGVPPEYGMPGAIAIEPTAAIAAFARWPAALNPQSAPRHNLVEDD